MQAFRNKWSAQALCARVAARGFHLNFGGPNCGGKAWIWSYFVDNRLCPAAAARDKQDK